MHVHVLVNTACRRAPRFNKRSCVRQASYIVDMPSTGVLRITVCNVPRISADKPKYMVMSRNQNAGRIHSVRTDNSTCLREGGRV